MKQTKKQKHESTYHIYRILLMISGIIFLVSLCMDIWHTEITQLCNHIVKHQIEVGDKIPKILIYVNNFSLSIITSTLVALFIQISSDKKEEQKNSLISKPKIAKINRAVKRCAHVPYRILYPSSDTEEAYEYKTFQEWCDLALRQMIENNSLQDLFYQKCNYYGKEGLEVVNEINEEIDWLLKLEIIGIDDKKYIENATKLFNYMANLKKVYDVKWDYDNYKNHVESCLISGGKDTKKWLTKMNAQTAKDFGQARLIS